MGGMLMYNFKVKSDIHDYEVEFIDDFNKVLTKELCDGDFLIIDNKIKKLYYSQLQFILEKYNYITLDASESLKSYQGIIPVIQTLIEKGFRKNNRLIAIGGGITQDVTAFISSIMYRGVSWIFFPTSLLAQGDSCIGSKTSINFEKFKNLVGGFYPPHKIYIYPNFLETLTQVEIKSGMGEMLHYFVVSGEDDFKMYKTYYKEAINDKVVLARIIARSLEIKKRYIEKDEFDQNIRQVFNYGHSFGHAIESLTNYEIPHGIAVSYGMDMANFISVKMGFISEEIRNEIRYVTEYIWDGYSIKYLDQIELISALSKDKKNVGSKLGLILNKGYGEVFKHLTEPNKKFKSWLEEYFNDLDK